MASVHKRRWTHKGIEKEAWCVRYFDRSGSRRSRTFDLKKQADAHARKVERESESGDQSPNARTWTVERVSEEFLRYTEQRCLDGRIGRSRLDILSYSFTSCINPLIGGKLLRDLREGDVEEMYRSMMEGGRMTALTARQRVQDLKLLEAFAMKRGYISVEPVTMALKDMRGLSRPPIRTFRPDQVAHLLRIAGERPFRQHYRTAAYMDAFVHLAALCGLRKGEIMGLTVKSVDFERRVIHVRHSLTRLNELKGPKTRAGIRDVPMPERVAEKLRHWVAEHFLANDLDLLFVTDAREPYLQGNIFDAWRRLLDRAGLADDGDAFHFHALRHFYASMLIHSGAPLPDAAKLMGHSTFDTTLQVYTHSVLQPEERHHLVDAMVSNMPGLTDARVP